MNLADAILRTRLRLPLIRAGLVVWSRLQEQVWRGLRGPLTLITAPAGFGKTTLVASCVAESGKSVAWLSLDKDDNRAGRFLTYLVAALQEADPTVGGEAVQLALAQQAPAEAVLTSLLNDLDRAGLERILVLDDYQFISSQAVHDQVAFLLDHCPHTFHLVIASRSDPPMPLARLRARGQSVELRAADLRFTEAEAAQFLNEVMGLHLDIRSVALLEAQTEGWVAGLQMAALSMRDRKDVTRFIEGFSGANRFILDYLLEEVLACQPEAVQTFLLQTAGLRRLSGPLCDAVTRTTGSQEMLEWLERHNLFILPLDEERQWYRYHHLFADLLQARLDQTGHAQGIALLSRAAEWFEQDGQIAEAASYAMTARDYGRVADLIVRYWQPMTNAGEIETVWSWLNALPEEMVKNSALISVIYCRMLWLIGQDLAIEAHLVDAERAWADLAASPDEIGEKTGSWPANCGAYARAYALIPAELSGLRSIVTRHQGDFEAARDFARRALSLIPENLPPRDDAQMRAVFSMPLAIAYDSLGDLEGAVRAYTETVRWSRVNGNVVGVCGTTYRLVGTLRLLGRLKVADRACREALAHIEAEGLSRVPAVGILHVAISEVFVEQNDLASAEDHLALGLELGKWGGRIKTTIYAAFAQSRIHLARNNPAGALAAVNEALEALSKTLSPLLKTELLALQSRVLVRQGALHEAEQSIEEALGLAGQGRGQTGDLLTLTATRVHLSRARPEQAVLELSRAIAVMEAGGRWGAAMELRILRSLALARQGNRQQADNDLEKALALAEPEGYVRVFLDEGQPMQQLLAQWLARAGSGPSRGYAARLLAQLDAESQANAAKKPAPTGAQVEAQALIEPLSPRELEVLRLMALGQTNQQIADRLVVARGTVKAQAVSIFRKLDASNRTEAVARARQLGILP